MPGRFAWTTFGATNPQLAPLINASPITKDDANAMADPTHKAPTQVIVAKDERSPFAQWVNDNWRMGAVLAAVAVVGVLYSQFRGHRIEQAQEGFWDTLLAAQQSADPEQLVDAAEKLAGTRLEGWAYFTAAQIHIRRREYQEAADLIQKLDKVDAPLLSGFALPIGPEGSSRSLVEELRVALESQRAQDEALSALFVNPPPPAEAPRVALEVETGEGTGTIVVALYESEAPLHVANFLKLVDEGHYDGIKFHRVIKGFMIQTGDPNTKDPGKLMSSWGQGSPGEEKIESETGDLVHAPYVLAAAKGAAPQSSATQFYITVGSPHHLDRIHTVFGAVVEGFEFVDQIADSKIRTQEAGNPTDIPVDPVPRIVSAKRIDG